MLLMIDKNNIIDLLFFIAYDGEIVPHICFIYHYPAYKILVRALNLFS